MPTQRTPFDLIESLSPPEQRPPEQRPPGQRPPEQRLPEQRPPKQRPPKQEPPEQEPPEQRPPGRGPIEYIAYSCCLVGFLVLSAMYSIMTDEKDHYLVCILFAIPTVEVFAPILFLKNKSWLAFWSTWIMVPSGIVLSLSWLFYTHIASGTEYPALLRWCLIGIEFATCLLLLSFSFYILKLIARGNEDSGAGQAESVTGLGRKVDRWTRIKGADSIIAELKAAPIYSIFLFFILFLNVTFLLGFILSFHHKNNAGTLQLIDSLQDQKSVYVGQVTLGNGTYAETEDSIKSRDIKERLKGLEGKIRITFQGDFAERPDDAQIDTPEALAGHRAKVLMLKMKEVFDERPDPRKTPRAIEWIFVQGTDSRFSSPVSQPPPGDGSSAFDVFVTKITEPPTLELLDYMYFMIYTILTTGYGDIIPNSPFSKFICSIANIFELFFMVIFFGLFLSFILQKKLPPSAPEGRIPVERPQGSGP